MALCIGTISGLHQRKNSLILQKKVALLSQRLSQETGSLKQSLALTEKQLQAEKEEKSTVIARYKNQVAQLKQKQAELFAGSINRLDERSKIIKTMMDHIGVKIEVEEDPGHSGGIYIDPKIHLSDTLINKTDQYLSLSQQLPLGRPIQSKITSKYGRRIDPLNHKKAFHAGIDFRGRVGDKVRVTGDGVVRLSCYGKGFGNHIIVRHSNGYETLYAHLSKRLVKRGDKVSRGEVIGLVGNTGRSTGSHLHYEVHLDKKTVNPMKFLQVARLIK